jgi:hypothetical protein
MSSAPDGYFTLLCVRADGFAAVIDLVPAESDSGLRDRALALLAEHASCQSVEAWRDSELVRRFNRA